MTPRLVLVTVNTPFAFNGGERMFVAPELPHLVQRLGPITLAPLHASGARDAVPAGVEVDTSLSDTRRRGRLADLLLAWTWPGFIDELRRALRRGGVVGAVRVWRWAAVARATSRWARRAFPAEDAPLLFYTYWRGGSTLALARLAAERPRTEVVTRGHRHELYEDAFDPPFQPWHPAMYDTLALTVAISAHGHDYLRGAGVDAARLALHRLGTEPAATLARASDDSIARVVSCSHASAVKRVPLIARTLVALARRDPARALHWTHFGGGPTLDDARAVLRDAPPNLAADLRGQVEHRAVLAHYAAQPVDGFVQLSASEGLPVALQEAASAGVPMVATDVGGVRELVGDDNGALLAADASADAAASALERVLFDTDAARRAARRQAARRAWETGFDARANHARFAARLRALMDTL
ncbi:MAG TPA: glycosyltransferase [Burkholderiaceae bacterium]|nr:glycosyltransferase [Burkholderiaceae bacterium]